MGLCNRIQGRSIGHILTRGPVSRLHVYLLFIPRQVKWAEGIVPFYKTVLIGGISK